MDAPVNYRHRLLADIDNFKRKLMWREAQTIWYLQAIYMMLAIADRYPEEHVPLHGFQQNLKLKRQGKSFPVDGVFMHTDPVDTSIFDKQEVGNVPNSIFPF